MDPISENVFAAERILKERKRKSKVEYLIKWKGWSARWNSWEPPENILDQRLMDEYESRKESIASKKKGVKRKSGSPKGEKSSKSAKTSKDDDEDEEDEDTATEDKDSSKTNDDEGGERDGDDQPAIDVPSTSSASPAHVDDAVVETEPPSKVTAVAGGDDQPTTAQEASATAAAVDGADNASESKEQSVDKTSPPPPPVATAEEVKDDDTPAAASVESMLPSAATSGLDAILSNATASPGQADATTAAALEETATTDGGDPMPEEYHYNSGHTVTDVQVNDNKVTFVEL